MSSVALLSVGFISGIAGTALGGYGLYLVYTKWGDDSKGTKILAYSILTVAIIALVIAFAVLGFQSVKGSALTKAIKR